MWEIKSLFFQAGNAINFMPIIWNSQITWLVWLFDMQDEHTSVFQPTQAENISIPLLSKYYIRIIA